MCIRDSAITGKAEAEIVMIGQRNGTGFADIRCDVRQTDGTWRDCTRALLGSSDKVFSTIFRIVNLDNNDDSGIIRGYCIGFGAKSENFDRSDYHTGTISSGAGMAAGYSSFDENPDEIRVGLTSGTFEGTDADKRLIADLYLLDRGPNDV